MKKLILIVCLLLLPMNIRAKTYTKKQCKQYAYEQVIKNKWTITDYNNLLQIPYFPPNTSVSFENVSML